jgi:glycosyltransferase involved in cell wall biosynthesis
LVRLPCILGFTAIPILIKSGRPFFIEIVSNAYEAYWNHGSFTGKICALFFDKLTKKYVKIASHVVYVAEKLHKDYPTEAQVGIISNVMILRILPKENVQISRFQSNIFKIGLIGSFQVKYKGQDILLKAVSLLENRIKENIELYFIGVGDFDWVIDIAKKFDLYKNIQFIGSIPYGEAIFDFLEKLTLYVQPSFQEGLPRAMLEAMSMACPVLGSTIGGIPEILQPNFLHTPGDYNKLFQQIKIFYDNRDLLYTEAINNLETVVPFLKENLDKKRNDFYTKIKNDLKLN